MVVVIILVVVILLLVISCVKVVPQAHAMVIERLGAYLTTWPVGLHFMVLKIRSWRSKI